MFRYILAVIAGYAVMAAIVMVGLFAPFLLKRDLAMEPGTLDVKLSFMVYALVMGFVAAAVGGWVCAKISRCHRVVLVLAGLAFVIGIVMAVQNYNKPWPTLTAEQIEKMPLPKLGEVGRQPDWYAFTLPFVAGIGILIGGRIRQSTTKC
jgi:hypothetical protein